MLTIASKPSAASFSATSGWVIAPPTSRWSSDNRLWRAGGDENSQYRISLLVGQPGFRNVGTSGSAGERFGVVTANFPAAARTAVWHGKAIGVWPASADWMAEPNR